MCMFVCLCQFMHIAYVQCLRRPEENNETPGTEVTGGWKHSCRGWESNQILCKDHCPLLWATEPSPQSWDSHACTIIFRRSLNQFLPLLSVSLSLYFSLCLCLSLSLCLSLFLILSHSFFCYCNLGFCFSFLLFL